MNESYDDRELAELRKRVDAIDEQILILLQKRLEEADRIGAYKRMHNLETEDPIREKHLHDRLQHLSRRFKLKPEFIHSLFELIISEAKRRQHDV